jgi:hypothetical protein
VAILSILFPKLFLIAAGFLLFRRHHSAIAVGLSMGPWSYPETAA